MKKYDDFNNAVEKYPVTYASSPSRPEYIASPTTIQQQEGTSPLDMLPAQWWNWLWNLATKDINAFKDYVGDTITEINNLLKEFDITLDSANTRQLYTFFHDKYVQDYLSTIFVKKSGDTIEGDLHVKGDLTVDGIGEEIISTELKVGANTITLRNENPTALGTKELSGIVTKNYDGNGKNNIIAVDKNGIARTGDIDITTRILFSSNGTSFFTDEALTEIATIGEDEEIRDTGSTTTSGIKIYEGITYSNDDTEPLTTRAEEMADGKLLVWNQTKKRAETTTAVIGNIDDEHTSNTSTWSSEKTESSINDALTDYYTKEEIDSRNDLIIDKTYTSVVTETISVDITKYQFLLINSGGKTKNYDIGDAYPHMAVIPITEDISTKSIRLFISNWGNNGVEVTSITNNSITLTVWLRDTNYNVFCRIIGIK